MGAHRVEYILNLSILFSNVPGSPDPPFIPSNLCFHYLILKISHYCHFSVCARGRSCLPGSASAVTDARARPGYVCKSLNSTCDPIDWIFERSSTSPDYSHSILPGDSEKGGVEVQKVFNRGRRNFPGRTGLTYRETWRASQCPYTSAGPRADVFVNGWVDGALDVDEPNPPEEARRSSWRDTRGTFQ